MPTDRDITTVTDRGQVSIPAHLRKELELGKGQQLRWEKVGEHELRIVILEAPQPRGARAMRGFARTFRDETRPTAEWMAELRAGER